jgi:ABC-type glycerol-3-phosphate transport system substrate-binding protein
MKLRPFEVVLVSMFAILALIALALIATYKPNKTTETVTLGSSVVIWGTVPAAAFTNMLEPLVKENQAYKVVIYEEKDARSFDAEVLNALADGRGPDIIFLPSEKLVQYRSKILPWTYESFPLRDFRDRYIDGAEIFALKDGVYAYPAAIDPMVMYYNRDLLSSKNIINPPATWEAVVNEVVPTLVERDFGRNIIRSPLAFGEYRNVQNGFGVMSTLLLQGNSAMVRELDYKYNLLLNTTPEQSGLPLENALTFYTNFASPSNPLYSWNRAQGMDHDEFLSEGLALYFGKASEARNLAIQNPNLNFDIAEVPQGASATIRRTYGSFYGFAVLRSAANPDGARIALQEIGSTNRTLLLANELGMAPAYRSSLTNGSGDRYGRIAYSAAKVARGWLNPSLDSVNTIFTQMVDDVLANRRRPSEAAMDAVTRLSDTY